jgi:hypothetical protein
MSSNVAGYSPVDLGTPKGRKATGFRRLLAYFDQLQPGWL